MWFPIALFAYFLFGIVKVIDRYLLTHGVPLPFAYAFFAGLFLSLPLLVITPFFLEVPDNPLLILMAILSGAIFTWALVGFFSAVKEGEATRAIPSIGAGVAISIFLLARFLLGENLGGSELLAFLFLLLGGILISLRISKAGLRFHQKEIGFVLFAAIFFALAWVLRKAVFSEHPFLSTLIWSGAGSLLGALSLLFLSQARQEIFAGTKKIPKDKKVFYIANQMFGGAASLIQNFAVSLGSVTLVNGLQGVENFFILLIALILAKKYPKMLKEEFEGFVMWQKGFAVLLIGIGLYLLSKTAL